MTAQRGPWFDDGFDDEPTREVLLEVDDDDLLLEHTIGNATVCIARPRESLLAVSIAAALAVSCTLAASTGIVVARVQATHLAAPAFDPPQPRTATIAEVREAITLSPLSAPNKDAAPSPPRAAPRPRPARAAIVHVASAAPATPRSPHFGHLGSDR